MMKTMNDRSFRYRLVKKRITLSNMKPVFWQTGTGSACEVFDIQTKMVSLETKMASHETKMASRETKMVSREAKMVSREKVGRGIDEGKVHVISRN